MSVIHARHGQGTLMMLEVDTAVIRFAHGIEQLLLSELTPVVNVEDAIAEQLISPSTEVVLKAQAEAIASVNNSWGVFTRSLISLLPHQLWVCHQALKTWPIRLLIADDVGMGKTIEAGLILWPLLANRRVQRLLILTPPKLVEQWQQRLKSMFDIRASTYHPQQDTERTDYWGIHSVVIASLSTLRTDHNDRHQRLLDAPAWDMLIVDEAHHLNVEHRSSRTLGFSLVDKLQRAGKVDSCILFTATPHRGKSHGFWSLMSLLNSNLFGPKKDEEQMLKALPNYLIRNAKQKATDMQGNRLFHPVQQFPETFTYTDAEEKFYQRMSEFIMAGKAYASSLSKTEGGQVILVLIALQKLASSSIAAVVSALKNRQKRLYEAAEVSKKELENPLDEPEDEDESMHALARWAEAEKQAQLKLMIDEHNYLTELIAAGEAVTEETRILRVIEIIKQRFPDESVLLFTEYKRTQALIVSALMTEFGKNTVGFINGDNKLNHVLFPDGRIRSLSKRREATCQAFNSGDIRFLISTEAGGEGIDLQQNCSALIHVDLPWNPMRLHQRVGRLNRYGQKKSVKVISLRNAATVEALIWDKLETKLADIMRTVGSAMDEPEDLLQLILGMSGDAVFEDLFLNASNVPRERFDSWFNEKTGTLGGETAVNTVKQLVGNAKGFDLSGLQDVPPVDLPELLPFFQRLIAFNQRRPFAESEFEISFKTPESWMTSHAIRSQYKNVSFSRKGESKPDNLMGVGHPLMTKALEQAQQFNGVFCVLEGLTDPLLIISVATLVTDQSSRVYPMLFGITGTIKNLKILRDWEVLRLLNDNKLRPKKEVEVIPGDENIFQEWLEEFKVKIPSLLSEMGIDATKVRSNEIAFFQPSNYS